MPEHAQVDQFVKIVERQIQLLDEVRKQIAPLDETRAQRNRRQILQAGAIAGAVAGSIISSIEAVRFLEGLYDNRALAEEYAKVAHQVYHIENNPNVAMKFMDQAIELDDSAAYRTDRVYYQSMQVVRNLLNLDRPYTQNN